MDMRLWIEAIRQKLRARNPGGSGDFAGPANGKTRGRSGWNSSRAHVVFQTREMERRQRQITRGQIQASKFVDGQWIHL